MLSLELKNVSEAPAVLSRINHQKVRAQAVSEVMPARYRQRMSQCCEWVKVRTFDNGYEKIDRLSCCCVRGCPVCDFSEYYKTMGKVAAAVRRQKKVSPTAGVVILKTVPEICGVSDLKSTFQGLSTKMVRVYRRKSFPTSVWARFMSVVPSGDLFSVSCGFILCVKPGVFRGNGYIGTAKWAEIIGQEVEKKHWLYGDSQCLNACAEIVKGSFLDLLAVKKELVPDFTDAVRKQMFRNFSRDFAQVDSKPPMSPSTAKRLHASRTDYSVFAPDVINRNYETERYLKTQDFDFDAVFDDVQLAAF